MLSLDAFQAGIVLAVLVLCRWRDDASPYNYATGIASGALLGAIYVDLIAVIVGSGLVALGVNESTVTTLRTVALLCGALFGMVKVLWFQRVVKHFLGLE